MARTQMPGTGIKDASVGTADLQDNCVIASKLGTGAIIGVDIMPYSDMLASYISTVTTKTQSGLITLAEAGLILADCTSNAMTLTLPNVTLATGGQYTIKKIDNSSNMCAVQTFSGSQFIDGILLRKLIVQYGYITLRSDGTQWHLLSEGPPNTSIPTLPNGMPSYWDNNAGEYLSVARSSLPFGVDAGNVRNVYLRMFAVIAGGTLYGITAFRNSIVMSMTAQISSPVAVDAIFQIRLVGSATPIYTITIPAGQTFAVAENVLVRYNTGQELQVYLTSAQSVTDPICNIDVAWRA